MQANAPLQPLPPPKPATTAPLQIPRIPRIPQAIVRRIQGLASKPSDAPGVRLHPALADEVTIYEEWITLFLAGPMKIPLKPITHEATGERDVRPLVREQFRALLGFVGQVLARAPFDPRWELEPRAVEVLGRIDASPRSLPCHGDLQTLFGLDFEPGLFGDPPTSALVPAFYHGHVAGAGGPLRQRLYLPGPSRQGAGPWGAGGNVPGAAYYAPPSVGPRS